MDSLQRLGLKYKTDKATHYQHGQSYLQRYEPYLQPKKCDMNNILEIGVRTGASLRLWKEYFPHSNIVGIDIAPETKKHEEERIEIFIGSQDDPLLIGELKKKYKPFDIIIDDGSHIVDMMLKSFEFLWPSINDGGLYIIEDTHTTYGPALMKWYGMEYNREDINLDNSRLCFVQFLSGVIEGIDNSEDDFFSLHVYKGFIIIKKNVWKDRK